MNVTFIEKLRNWAIYKIPPDIYSRIEREYLLSAEEQQALNLQRRIATYRHAFQNIPFYHEKYSKAGFDLDSIKTDADFCRLPLLTKAEVRTSAPKMIAVSDSLDKLSSGATGGSTGEPVRFYYDPQIPAGILGWAAVSRLGIEMHDSAGYVGRGVPTRAKQRLRNICFFPQRIAYLDAAQPIGAEQMQRFADELIKIRAKYIRGYVGGIMQFAEFCRSQQIRIPGLRLVWTSSAPLPDFQRHMLQETFGCPAYTQYGCCEIPWLGMECTNQSGLHTYSTIRHIEIIDENGQPTPVGKIGNVAVTNLLDYRFPLIRYVNGDRSSYLEGECGCSNHSPRIDYIHGRVTDCLLLSDGSSLFGDYLTTVFDGYPDAVKAFQFHQYSDNRIKFSIVKNAQYSNADREIEEVVNKFKSLIAGRNVVEIAFCDEIAADRGKTRFVIRDH